MYTIKQKPEDFIVEEATNANLLEKGAYAIYLMKKKDLTSEQAIEQICNALRISRKLVSYAGNKDKKAITSQYISIKGVNKKELKLNNLELSFAGFSDKPLSLGDIKENKFIITVRNLDRKTSISKISAFPNYFDEQRFSKDNAEVGRLLVKKDFRKAAEIIIRDDLQHGRLLADFLIEQNHNYVAALRQIHKKTLLLYIHAFQSFVFNQTISEYLRRKAKKYRTAAYSLGEFIFPSDKIKNIEIPVVGFGTEMKNKEISEIIVKILEKEGVSLRDFIIPQLPEITSCGDTRKLFARIKNLKCSRLEDDELNKGRFKMKISFSLPKGSYATLTVKSFFAD